ncbi:hypothetical protein I4U23_016713 [Adineta vaga]|nr:hypothetical protein I4U23_016713 [Adineta vaga]
MSKPTGMSTHTAERYNFMANQMHDWVNQNSPPVLHPARGGIHQFHASPSMANESLPGYAGPRMSSPNSAGIHHSPGFGVSVGVGVDVTYYYHPHPYPHPPSIESLAMFMDGFQWEDMITKHLIHLKTFRCVMALQLDFPGNTKETIFYFLRLFQSQFWIENHQCGKHSILYHTLPYRFIHLITIIDYIWSRSTSSYENDYCKYNSIYKSLMKIINEIFKWNTNETKLTLSSDDINSTLCFDNVRERSVELPFNTHFWKSLSKLDQLVSLNIKLTANFTDQSDLQFLPNQTPNLYSLSIICPERLISRIVLTNIQNTSIRELNLLPINSFDKTIFYNIKQCIELSHSSLGKQCEILTIGVKNRQCIIYLINKMINLRSLTFRYSDNNVIRFAWIKCFLPSTSQIIQSNCCDDFYYLWIR